MPSLEKTTEAIQNDESLEIFLRKMREFDEAFCKFMFKGSDFNIKLEVRGNKSEILYVRVNSNDSEQPNGVQKRIDNKNSEN